MKVAIIGGGSSYTPELIEGFILRRDSLPVKDLVLVDIEEGQEKLDIIYELSKRMLEKAGSKIKLTKTLDRDQALKGASYVLTQLRVGRIEARAKDESIPLKYQRLGQETTGAGGFAKALRTIPVILSIAKDMERLCPDAWLINFTNPSGMVTEAVLKNSKIRSIGLCNAPIGLQRGLADQLKIDPKDLYVEYVGLNHLSWTKRIFVKGRDVTEELFSKDDFVEYVAGIIGGHKGAKELVAALKTIPSYYCSYFFFEDQAIQKDLDNIKEGKGTRADQVMALEEDLFKLYASPDLDEKPEQLSKRGGALYSEAALSLIESIHNNDGKMHIVNVMNKGAITGLPHDGVIETNCIVNKSGAHPIASGQLPRGSSALTKAVKAYEQLTIEAAIDGCRQTALLALVSNPLIHGADKALDILNDLLKAHKPYLPQFYSKEE